MPDKPSAPGKVTPIALLQVNASTELREAVAVFNAILNDADLLANLPEDLPATTIHAHLSAAVQTSAEWGDARANLSKAVETKSDAVKRGKAVEKRVRGIVEASYPPGTPGRSNYFPTDKTDPTLGDLLIAFGKGIEKAGRPKLPEGWTAAFLQQLGGEVNAALIDRATRGVVRKGTADAAAAQAQRTQEIRRRLRALVTEWYGPANTKLLAFSIRPRRPATGSRRRKTAVVPTPDTPA
jgi:hypothetical protein